MFIVIFIVVLLCNYFYYLTIIVSRNFYNHFSFLACVQLWSLPLLLLFLLLLSLFILLSLSISGVMLLNWFSFRNITGCEKTKGVFEQGGRRRRRSQAQIQLHGVVRGKRKILRRCLLIIIICSAHFCCCCRCSALFCSSFE